jgi:hypothetical protein
MDSDPTEIEALLRIATALVIGVDSAMDRLLSLLPRAAPVRAHEIAA